MEKKNVCIAGHLHNDYAEKLYSLKFGEENNRYEDVVIKMWHILLIGFDQLPPIVTIVLVAKMRQISVQEKLPKDSGVAGVATYDSIVTKLLSKRQV